MSFSVRYVPAILFTILSLVGNVCVQTTTSQTTKTPRGSISGRVTIKDKGAAGVSIGVRRDGINPFEAYTKTVTDHDGYYRINDLSAGAYEVYPSAPAFVIAENNNNEKTKSVIVAEDENVETINFSLVRGGVITGKVTDADGRPLIQQQVYLFPADTPEQRQGQVPRPMFTTNAVQTDDRGIYRMYGLVAGRYKVAAGRADRKAGTASNGQTEYNSAGWHC
jgi:Carboxypeptidase regulatory-like domain